MNKYFSEKFVDYSKDYKNINEKEKQTLNLKRMKMLKYKNQIYFGRFLERRSIIDFNKDKIFSIPHYHKFNEKKIMNSSFDNISQNNPDLSKKFVSIDSKQRKIQNDHINLVNPQKINFNPYFDEKAKKTVIPSIYSYNSVSIPFTGLKANHPKSSIIKQSNISSTNIEGKCLLNEKIFSNYEKLY